MGFNEDTVRTLLEGIGEDPDREGLRETPARVVAAWSDWTSGYDRDPKSILKVFKDAQYNELVFQADIPVWSMCEHHLAPFFGVAHIGYIADGAVVGLSKLYRLVEIFGRRLQVQERLTQQIARALDDNLKPKGVGVALRCRHTCMESRGIKVAGTITSTQVLRGGLREHAAARAEFLQLVSTADANRRV
jgi:GTP cyclohydrolase I